MNAIVPQNFGAVSTVFANVPRDDDMSAGIAAGFGIIGYKGKVWSTRYRGTDTNLMRPDNDGPMNSIEVVIVKASGSVSKIWYEAGYVEGSSAAPDCYSTNGVVPDVGSKKKQCNSCALCPQNQWGSRITPAGRQGKSCSDSKRLAIVPLPDIPNEGLGGPMLLRVPAASLRDLASFDDKMKALGYPYYSIGCRISFDAAESYPKFVFGAIRPLTDVEARQIMEHRDSRAVSTILAEGSERVGEPVAEVTAASAFEQPPVVAIAAPVAAPAPAPAPAAAPVTAAPVTHVTPLPASGGFGGAVVAAPAKVTPQVTAIAAPIAAPIAAVAQPTTGVGSSAFEAALDEQLDALLA
jgi:hypothetical protein